MGTRGPRGGFGFALRGGGSPGGLWAEWGGNRLLLTGVLWPWREQGWQPGTRVEVSVPVQVGGDRAWPWVWPWTGRGVGAAGTGPGA